MKFLIQRSWNFFAINLSKDGSFEKEQVIRSSSQLQDIPHIIDLLAQSKSQGFIHNASNLCDDCRRLKTAEFLWNKVELLKCIQSSLGDLDKNQLMLIADLQSNDRYFFTNGAHLWDETYLKLFPRFDFPVGLTQSYDLLKICDESGFSIVGTKEFMHYLDKSLYKIKLDSPHYPEFISTRDNEKFNNIMFSDLTTIEQCLNILKSNLHINQWKAWQDYQTKFTSYDDYFEFQCHVNKEIFEIFQKPLSKVQVKALFKLSKSN